MKEFDQRIEIASYCGWTNLRVETSPQYPGDKRPCLFGTLSGSEDRSPPDYLNDLNAMQEALAKLDSKHLDEFVKYLYCLNNLDIAGILIKSSAKDTAEAFLRTTGRWKD